MVSRNIKQYGFSSNLLPGKQNHVSNMAIIPDLCKMIVGSGKGMCKNDINNNAIVFFVQGLWDDSLIFDPQKKGLRLCLLDKWKHQNCHIFLRLSRVFFSFDI